MKSRSSIIVLEGFYANPERVRDYALRQEYYTPYEDEREVRAGRQPVSWWASWFKRPEDCPFKSSKELIETLEQAVGETIDLDHWRALFPVDAGSKPLCDPGEPSRTCLWNCCFHIKPDNGQKLGEGVHNHVTDRWNSVGRDGWAGIVYLNRFAPLEGGLHLWRNIDPERQHDWMSRAGNWEQIDSFGNVFNRLVLVRGDIPHSGARGWGNRLDNSRMYQTFFFRTVAERTLWPVKLPDGVG